jgi:hypothetical protein
VIPLIALPVQALVPELAPIALDCWGLGADLGSLPAVGRASTT